MGIKKKIANVAKDSLKKRAINGIISPVTQIVDENLAGISSAIGMFVVRNIRNKFQRSIEFSVGVTYGDSWMEEALYGILYEYNNIKQGGGTLRLSSNREYSSLYCQLGAGMHYLKYRKWNIILAIEDKSIPSQSGRINQQRNYTIITYDLSPEFVKFFEKDMLRHRNSLLKIRSEDSSVNVYHDLHEGDGYTYWEKMMSINKRRIGTIYLPMEQKQQIVNTINEFFANAEFYKEHGIAHNLKILLYGPPGSGKDSIAKMIASEWNRNIYYITGGKDGRFIPNALTDNDDTIHDALLLISDIDKYPYLINEPDVKLDDANSKDENVRYKQQFGSMINALDGIMSGEDRIIIMTTNHIEKFSETIMRPGRVDLKMEIGYVTPEVFRQYVYDFYHVVLPKDIKLKKDNVTVAMLQSDVMFIKLSADEFIDKYVKKKGD